MIMNNDKQNKILLVDVDSTIPNMALMKLSTFHKHQGNVVEIVKLQYSGIPGRRTRTLIDNTKYNKVYASVIFTPNKDVLQFKCPKLLNYQVGGTGTLDFSVKLSDEVDNLEEDFSLYPENDEMIGFTSRGCIRNCFFCFVRRKEGLLSKYREWERIVKTAEKYGLKKIRFLDNNFLANKHCEETMQGLIDANVRCSFNEGLDFRLVDDKKAELLSKLRYYPTEFIFAFDDIAYLPIIDKQYKILRKHIIKDWKIKFYCYLHPDMPLSATVRRLEWAKKNKALIYIMKDKACYSAKYKNFYRDLCSWANAPGIYKNYTFIEHMKHKTKNMTRRMESVKLYEQNIKETK